MDINTDVVLIFLFGFLLVFILFKWIIVDSVYALNLFLKRQPAEKAIGERNLQGRLNNIIFILASILWATSIYTLIFSEFKNGGQLFGFLSSLIIGLWIFNSNGSGTRYFHTPLITFPIGKRKRGVAVGLIFILAGLAIPFFSKYFAA